MTTKAELQAENQRLKDGFAAFIKSLDASARDAGLCDDYHLALTEAANVSGLTLPQRNWHIDVQLTIRLSVQREASDADDAWDIGTLLHEDVEIS